MTVLTLLLGMVLGGILTWKFMQIGIQAYDNKLVNEVMYELLADGKTLRTDGDDFPPGSLTHGTRSFKLHRQPILLATEVIVTNHHEEMSIADDGSKLRFVWPSRVFVKCKFRSKGGLPEEVR